METKNITSNQYAYKREPLHKRSEIGIDKIATVAKIWATVIPNWGVPGKRVRNGISVEKCFLAKTRPETLTEEQFEIFTSCPIDHRYFFRYNGTAKRNKSKFVRIWQSKAEAIDAYIQKYQHLLPAEAEAETPTEQTAPENISN
jgi:hypothetical protein